MGVRCEVVREAPSTRQDKKRAPWQPLAPKALDLLVIDDPAFTAGIVITPTGTRWSAVGGQRQRDLVDTDQAALPPSTAPRSCTGAISVSIVVSVWCRLAGSVAGYGKTSPGVFDVAAVKRV
jgi:hypothetical protein